MMLKKLTGFITVLGLLMLTSLNAAASGKTGLHQTVTNLLAKHAVKLRQGQFNGYVTKSVFDYHADRCELRIKRVLEWRHTRTSTSTRDHGASYRIPLKKVKLKRGKAVNRLKLDCHDKECIAKRLHKKCNGRRRCRRDKTVSAYYLQIRPDFKENLAQHIGKLVKVCNTN